MSKQTDKFTRNYSDFSNYPFPGRNLPSYYDHLENAGDGNPGLQYMMQKAISAYGPRHVVSGIQVQTGATNSVTGTVGYYMWDGEIKQWNAKSGVIAANQYAYISGDGTLNFASTGQYNSGLMIAVSGEGGIKNITQRWDANKLLYSLVERLEVSQITGTYLSNITGSDAQFNDLYINNVSGSQITGTSGLINVINIGKLSNDLNAGGFAISGLTPPTQESGAAIYQNVFVGSKGSTDDSKYIQGASVGKSGLSSKNLFKRVYIYEHINRIEVKWSSQADAPETGVSEIRYNDALVAGSERTVLASQGSVNHSGVYITGIEYGDKVEIWGYLTSNWDADATDELTIGTLYIHYDLFSGAYYPD